MQFAGIDLQSITKGAQRLQCCWRHRDAVAQTLRSQGRLPFAGNLHPVEAGCRRTVTQFLQASLGRHPVRAWRPKA